jgi:WxL domain surface cell wall-binding
MVGQRRLRGIAVIAMAVLAILLSTYTGASAQTADQLDQQVQAASANPNFTGFNSGAVAQTFTDGISGSIDRVAAYIGIASSGGGDVTAEIQTLDSSGNPACLNASAPSSCPAGSILGSGTLAAASVTSTPAWVTIQLSTLASVTAGHQYALVMTSASSSGSYSIQILNDPYAGGQFIYGGSYWNQNAGAPYDMAFQTYVIPTTGGGPTSASVAAGSSSVGITGGTPGTFTATLNGSDQFVYTSLSPFTVSDSRGSGAGWHLTLQATQFTCSSGSTNCPSNTANDSLPSGSLDIGTPAVAAASGTSGSGGATPPSISGSYPTSIDTVGSTALTIASAAQNTGMGTYTFTPGTLSCPSGGTCGVNGAATSGKLQLIVPSSAYATTYTSTLTISAISGP